MKCPRLIPIIIIAALSIAASHAVLPSYTAYDLGRGQSFAVNSSGTVVGTRHDSNMGSHAFSFYAGKMTDLGSLGGDSSSALHINDAGDIVGASSTISGGYYHGFLHRNGTMMDIGTLGRVTYARGINSAGTIVGESQLNAPYYPTHAFAYKAGAITDLGTLGGLYSSATAINSAGVIVGHAETPGSTRAFRYDNGVMKDLGSFSSGPSYACAINDAGTIVGYSFTSQGYYHAFRYVNGVMQDLGALRGGSSEAYGINSSGVIVGASDALGSSGWTRHAVVYMNGSVIDLAPYLASAGFAGLSVARDINDNGDIVGYAADSGGYLHAFLLSVPEPSTPALLLLGAVICYRRRRANVPVECRHASLI